MKQLVITVIFSLLAMACLIIGSGPFTADAEPDFGVLVSGTVYETNGMPVENAAILFITGSDTTRTTSAPNGGYSIVLYPKSDVAVTDVTPFEFSLGQNYPNPFNPSTTIEYSIPETSHVRIDVYSTSGQHITSLVDADMEAGLHGTRWNGVDDTGRKVAAGVYLYTVRAGEKSLTRKMVLIDGGGGTAQHTPFVPAAKRADAVDGRKYEMVVSHAGYTEFRDTVFVNDESSGIEKDIELSPNGRSMFLYRNYWNTMYEYDYLTLEYVRTITFDLPDSVECFNVCMSENNERLIFAPSTGIVTYTPATRTVDYYPHGLTAHTARITRSNTPGRVFLWSSWAGGLYEIDYLNRNVAAHFEENTDLNIEKSLYRSPSGNILVARRHEQQKNYSWSELHVYRTGSLYDAPSIILNDKDRDGIIISDLEFSKDERRIYVTYLASDGSSRDVEVNVGWYDIETGEFHRTGTKLPWAGNPYYLSYSPARDEVYTVATHPTFYILDGTTLEIEGTVPLYYKQPGASRITLRPDEAVAFVTSTDTNCVYVVNLDTRDVEDVVIADHPYRVIIP